MKVNKKKGEVKKMKLEYTTPTGVKGNLFDIKGIGSLILGTFVLLFTFAMGQNLAAKVNGKAAGFIDTKPTYPFEQQQQINVNKKEVY
jgi:hypothetical protein